MIEIRRMTEETKALLFTIEDRRFDGESILVRTKKGGFSLEYKPLPAARWQTGFPVRDMIDLQGFGDDARKGIFFAWLDGAFAGQMLVDMHEMRLARVVDLRVDIAVRKRGVGRALLDMAETWAQTKQCAGLVVETQDQNAGACQFLARCGFELGGVDSLRYVTRSRHTLRIPALRQTALFFYRFFDEGAK